MTGLAAVSIRPARRNDVPGIVALLADDPIGRQREMPAVMARYLTAFDALMAGSTTRCLVAVDADDTVIGYVQMTVTQHLSYQGARRALLEDLRVAPTHRNKAIGGKLIEAAISGARSVGCEIVQLFVHQRRKEAHRFYRRLGFQADHLGFRLKI